MLRPVKKTGVVTLKTTTRMNRISAGPARRATNASWITRGSGLQRWRGQSQLPLGLPSTR